MVKRLALMRINIEWIVFYQSFECMHLRKEKGPRGAGLVQCVGLCDLSVIQAMLIVEFRLSDLQRRSSYRQARRRQPLRLRPTKVCRLVCSAVL